MQKIFKIPQASIVRAFVTGYTGKRTVAQAAYDFHTTIRPGNRSIVVNADGFPSSPFISNSKWVSDGSVKNNVWMEWRPVVAFDKSHKMAMWFRGQPYYWPEKITVWNAFSLTRRLIVDGKINPAFQDNHEINSRIGFGITASRELSILGIDGWDIHHTGLPPQGWTLTQLANQMIDQGVVEGGDGDAGGSYTLAIDGMVVNDWYNDNEGMRSLVNHFCLEVTDIVGVEEPTEPPPEPPADNDGGAGEPAHQIVDIDVNYDDGTRERFIPKP